MNYFDDEYYMRKALSLAESAADAGEVPVGAVAVKDGIIIAKAWNQSEMLKDATAHAEILAITQAEIALGGWRLDGVTIYVTKEPCAMCAGAMVNSRISRLVFGMKDPKCGCAGSVLNIPDMPGFLHRFEVLSGLLANESESLMKAFFKNVRKSKDRKNKSKQDRNASTGI